MRTIGCALALSSLTGCASGGGSRPPASLTEAAREASKPEDKQKALPTDPSAPGAGGETAIEVETEVETAIELATLGTATHERPGERPHLGMLIGGGALGGGHVDGFPAFGFQAGVYASSRLRLDLEGVFMPVQFTDESNLGRSLDHAMMFAVDISARWYLSPPHTFLSVYPIGGVRLGQLTWDYSNALLAYDANGVREVWSDALGFFTPYVGAGVALAQARHVHLGVRGTSGLQIYHWQSREGFSNDLFDPVWVSEARIELGYVF
jgi:hypothetical protein